MGFIQWCDFRVWTTCSSICGNKSVGECKPSARRPVRPASLSSTSSGQAGCIVGLLCDSRQPWMFVMRPIIHSICSVSAESLHCSPTIEPWGAFNPSTSRAGRRPFCDIMHSSNTLSESANQPSLPSWLQLLQVCWWRGCWHGCISARWVGMKEFQRGKQSHHFLFQPADLMSYLYSWCDYSIPLLFNSHYQRDTSVGDPSWIPWPPVFLWGLTLPLQQLHSPLDFPASIRSCHSAAGGMLLVVPSSLKRTYWIAFFSFSQKPAFGRSVDIIWILGLVCCLVKQP